MGLGGFRIGTIRGIPIRIHFTFLLVLPFLAFAFAQAFRAAARIADVPPEQLQGSPWLWGLGVALALFGSVLVHELAHSLYALRTGGRVRDITLLMIGGVSQMSEPPRRARDEAVMALVGPAVSLALGGLFQFLHTVSPASSFNLKFALFYLGTLNLFLGIFNLLPAFPMDGGRILRALLAPRMGLVGATRVASRVGKGFAFLFGLWGLFTFNTLLLIIAFFVYLGAEGEKESVVARDALAHLHVSDLMSSAELAVPADATVEEAASRMVRARQVALAATAQGRPIGFVTLAAVQRVPPEQRPLVLARDIVTAQPETLAPNDEADRALALLGESSAPVVAVVDDGQVVGTVSREDVARGLQLKELHVGRRGEGPPAATS